MPICKINWKTKTRIFHECTHADLLESGQQEIVTIYPDKEGVYKYYDKRERLEHLGFLEVKTVVHSDEFTGIWRDLI